MSDGTDDGRFSLPDPAALADELGRAGDDGREYGAYVGRTIVPAARRKDQVVTPAMRPPVVGKGVRFDEHGKVKVLGKSRGG